MDSASKLAKREPREHRWNDDNKGGVALADQVFLAVTARACFMQQLQEEGIPYVRVDDPAEIQVVTRKKTRLLRLGGTCTKRCTRLCVREHYPYRSHPNPQTSSRIRRLIIQGKEY